MPLSVGPGPFGLLPPGRHTADLIEIEALFVSGAPYSAERALLWSSFLLWEGQVRALMPSSKLWINGGFVTHKTWEAPDDIDVFVLAKSAEALPVAASLPPLLSQPDGKGGKIHAMSGAIDSFLGIRGDAPTITFYDGWWRKVKDENDTEVPGVLKGYVEVSA